MSVPRLRCATRTRTSRRAVQSGERVKRRFRGVLTEDAGRGGPSYADFIKRAHLLMQQRMSG